MKSFKNLKKISCLLALLSCASLFAFGCGGSKEVTTKTEKAVVATKSTAPKEIKVTKPNEGGLKQELSTRATVSTTNKKEVTFEIPASQLQGLKVGDAMVINSGKQSYPAKILTMPSAPQLKQGQPFTGSKVIVTASVGPGVNLPPNNNGYIVTYLYNNRDPRSHYIKKEYIYYDGPRAYVNVTGPDRVIRRKYIRTGLINRYYAEILDELDAADRIVENYINDVNDYVNNIVIPNILDDYNSQVIDAYTEYIKSLNERWDVDDDVNYITIDVNDIDWDKLEDDDIILTDDDIVEITEEVITETHEMVDDSQVDMNDNDDGGVSGGGSFDDKVNDKNDDNNEGGVSGGGSFDDKNDDNGGVSGSGSFDDKNDDNDKGGVAGGGSFDDKANDKSEDKDDDEVVVTGNFNDNREETTEEVTERQETEEATEITDAGDNDVNDNAVSASEDNDTNDDSNNNSNDDSNDDSNNDSNETTTIDDDAVSNE